jgi:thioredoxin reductase (NADPH)
MPKPTILAVDDEPTVLAAVGRDLRRQYGGDYRILSAGSGIEALELLRELKQKGDPVALLVVDQRMPEMTGVELLREAVLLYPESRRVLLTAYADTDAAIRAINEVRLDHYLMKPWDPPEERLYPVLTDLLEAWRAGYRPPFEGVRVVSHRWSADGHRVRDFLARNLVPYRWLDVEEDAEARELIAAADRDDVPLPLLVFPDGSRLERPSNEEIGVRVGLRAHPDQETYDLLIVGGGPAGLAAAVYGASEGLRTLLVEREAPGGQAGMSSRIENYLGFPVGLSGGDLTRRAVAQARRFGAEILTPREATGIRLQEGYPLVALDDGQEVAAQALLICTGVSYRRLDVPGAAALEGAGLFYGAAITEAMAARDQDVFVVGGGNSAGQAAVYLARFARTVTILVRSDSVDDTMSRYLIRQIEETANIQVRLSVEITAAHGSDTLEGVTLRDRKDGTEEEVPAAAVFIFIGAVPRTEWLGDLVATDRRGFILSGPAVMQPDGSRPPGWAASRDPLWLETNVPGIFTAGDVRHRSIKRVASAVGEGSMAVQFIHTHLRGSVLAPTPAMATGR